MRKQTYFLISLIKLFIFISFLFIMIVLLYSYLAGPPPLPTYFETVFYTKNEKPFEQNLQDHKQIKLNELENHIIQATLIVEDKHFYHHFGFDLRGIVRAFFKNIRSLKLKEGASTITQQYARNLYLTHDKTWKRKIKEALYTIRLEMFYSKDEILEGYLNSIYYGHGAYGINEASHFYFNKHINDLSIAELSLIVGIPKGPTYYSPFNNEEKAFQRQKDILALFRTNNLIEKQQYERALRETLTFAKQDRQAHSIAPYFRDHVLKEAADILKRDPESILNDGYHIYTTLDETVQRKVEQITKETLKDTDQLEVGILVTQPKTGAIYAMLGGRSYENSTFNRTTSAKRLVGSTFKPFIYYSALENGFLPQTMLKSEPTTFAFDGDKQYKPQNYNNYYANKPITLAQALALSDNIYAVKTNMFLGPKNVIKTAKKFGIKSKLPEVPSLALGSASITINEMAQAYSMISNGGKDIKNHTITKIIDRYGQTIYERKQGEHQLLDEKKTFILSQLLTGMFDPTLNGHMEVTGSSILPLLTHDYAGKSGTTETDSWMIGYQPNLLTAVWTGYDDNRPINDLKKQQYAKQIWAKIMEATYESKSQEITVPSGIVALPFDHETGKIATEHCPNQRLTYFEKGTEPKEVCELHKQKEEENEQFFKRIFDLFFN